MGKNIVVFADGTGQEGGVTPNTNVYALFNMIEDRSERQISFYDRGLGTGRRKLTAIISSISGRGIAQNTQECYEFISNCYNTDDHIYLFGFSRGATTVRTLAAFIHRFGILPKSRPELFQKAYAIYKIRNKEKRRKRAKDFTGRNHTTWCRIKFLGVWDTVAALGIPLKTLNLVIDKLPFAHHSYHDLRLSKCVDFARQALAIDDERRTFQPSLWDERKERHELRQLKDATLDVSTEDITHLYLVAAKLKAAADPISIRIKQQFWDPKTQELIDDFNVLEPGPSQSSELGPASLNEKQLRIEELKSALVKVFNKAIKDMSPDELPSVEGMELYIETQAIHDASSSDQNLNRQRLNRRCLEYEYLLKPANPPRIKQVWFAGMHTDVGGGYPDYELAHVPLLWMLKEAMDAGLRIYPSHNVALRPDATGKMHNSREKLGRFYRRRVRSWNPHNHQGNKPLVHESVLVRQQCEDLQYEPWILKQDIECESWPTRLRASIQFDDYFIWRESIWGFGAAFAVPWSSVKRISYGQAEGTIKLYVRDQKDPILIKGISSARATDIASAFEHYRQEAQEQEQQKTLVDLNKNDTEHNRKIAALEAEIESLKNQLKTTNGEFDLAIPTSSKTNRKRKAK